MDILFKIFMNSFFQKWGWSGLIGLIGGGLGILIGLHALLTSGPIVALIGILFISIFVWFFWHYMFKGMVEAKRLLAQGEASEATILTIAENGSSLQINGVPKVGVTITLEVRPASKPVYQAALNTYLSMLEIPEYRAGKTIQVKFDPANPQKIVIDKNVGAKSGAHLPS